MNLASKANFLITGLKQIEKDILFRYSPIKLPLDFDFSIFIYIYIFIFIFYFSIYLFIYLFIYLKFKLTQLSSDTPKV